MAIVLEITNLSVRFADFFALQEVGFTVESGEFVAIVGPNGAGKSTLLRVLLNLVPNYQGQVNLFGRPLAQVSPDWLGYVPQFKTMDRRFPAQAIELVTTGLSRIWPWKVDSGSQQKAYAALQQVGAEHLAKRAIATLSGGELQRVCLARSIVREPRLIMLDEPATGIDTVGESDMYNLLEAYQAKSGATLLMITHDWHAATHHADKVLLLNRRQISYGSPQDALNEQNLRTAFGHIGHEHRLKSRYDNNV